jgi:uncharacterized protein (UPF0212 family)
MSEASTSVFKLKRSDIQVTEVNMPLYIYKCPICGRTMTSVYRDKLLASAKLHIKRTHGLKVEVE